MKLLICFMSLFLYLESFILKYTTERKLTYDEPLL